MCPEKVTNFVFIQMSSIIAKLACFGSTLMEGSELNYYFSFLKDQLKSASVSDYLVFLIVPPFDLFDLLLYEVVFFM